MAPPDCDPPERYPPNAYGSGKHSVEPCTYSQSLVIHSNMPADAVSFPTPTSSLGTLAIYFFFLFCIVAGFLYFLERLSCVIAQLQNQFIAKDDLELCPSCLYLLSAGTAGICHHIQFLRCWGQNPGLRVLLGKQCTNQASGPALLFCADSATNQQTRTHCQWGQIQACSLLAGWVQGVMKKGSRWGFLCLRTGGMATWRSPHQHA